MAGMGFLTIFLAQTLPRHGRACLGLSLHSAVMPAKAGIQYSTTRTRGDALPLFNSWDYWIIRFRG
jgi:hypothetical protein